MRRLSEYHPAVILVYFLSVLLISMFTANPAVLLPSFAGALSYLLMIDRKRRILKDLWFYAVLFLLIALTNPLFSHNGVTPLFFLNGQAVTLESVLYGAGISLMLSAVLAWFGALNRVLTSEKLLFLLGRVSPKLSVVVSSALRFLPLFREKAAEIRSAGTAIGLYASERWTDRIRSSLAMLSALVTFALEHSVETGASMKARGYRLKGRSHYSVHRFSGHDLFLLLAVLGVDALFFTVRAFGKLNFAFYPSILFERPDAASVAAYYGFAVLSLLPLMLEIGENVKWHYYRSKI